MQPQWPRVSTAVMLPSILPVLASGAKQVAASHPALDRDPYTRLLRARLICVAIDFTSTFANG